MAYYEDYLAHHGIKGQKWGVRRFQNADGTRTALGKKREQRKETAEEEHARLTKSSSAEEVYKNRAKLSDKELRDRVNRIQTEQQLQQLMKNEKRTSAGKKASGKVLGKIGEKSAEALAVGVVAAGKKAVITGTLATAGTMAIASLIANSNPYSKLWLY